MKNSLSASDVAALRDDLHGQDLAVESTQQPDGDRQLHCDFCEATLSANTPLQIDAIRNYDMHNLDRMLGPLEGWWIDSVRCPDCAVDRVYPPTDGWEEAVVSCSPMEQNGVFSVDATDLSVLDYSPGPEGHYPPAFDVATIDQVGVSFCRWSFLYRYLPLAERTVPDLYDRQFIYQYYRDRLDEIEQETAA